MNKKVAHFPSYPWRKNNSFTLLVDSKEFYPEILRAITQAKCTVILEQYLIQSGAIFSQFIKHFLEAAKRNVQIYILLDDYGSKEVSTADLNKLRHPNIHISHYNPFRWSHLYNSLRRNHRKLILIDQRIAFVGGAGISDDYLQNQKPNMIWHDIMLRIEGDVVHDWFDSFNWVWQKHSRIDLISCEPATDFETSQSKPHTGRVLLASGPGRNQIIRTVIRQINKSKQRVWIVTPYFLTTRKLRHALIKAARRGVDVRLLLPGEISDHQWISQAARVYYTQLLRNEIRIYEYQPRFIHTKLVICDDWVSIGSSNLDRWNQFWNLDANLAIHDSVLLSQVTRMFKDDLAESALIDYQAWCNRPLLQKLSEWWSSYIVRLIQSLVYLSTRRKKKTD